MTDRRKPRKEVVFGEPLTSDERAVLAAYRRAKGEGLPIRVVPSPSSVGIFTTESERSERHEIERRSGAALSPVTIDPKRWGVPSEPLRQWLEGDE